MHFSILPLTFILSRISPFVNPPPMHLIINPFPIIELFLAWSAFKMPFKFASPISQSIFQITAINTSIIEDDFAEPIWLIILKIASNYELIIFVFIDKLATFVFFFIINEISYIITTIFKYLPAIAMLQLLLKEPFVIDLLIIDLINQFSKTMHLLIDPHPSIIVAWILVMEHHIDIQSYSVEIFIIILLKWWVHLNLRHY